MAVLLSTFLLLFQDCLGPEDQGCFRAVHRHREEETGKGLPRYLPVSPGQGGGDQLPGGTGRLESGPRDPSCCPSSKAWRWIQITKQKSPGTPQPPRQLFQAALTSHTMGPNAGPAFSVQPAAPAPASSLHSAQPYPAGTCLVPHDSTCWEWHSAPVLSASASSS